jgi:hypothetical protein
MLYKIFISNNKKTINEFLMIPNLYYYLQQLDFNNFFEFDPENSLIHKQIEKFPTELIDEWLYYIEEYYDFIKPTKETNKIKIVNSIIIKLKEIINTNLKINSFAGIKEYQIESDEKLIKCVNTIHLFIFKLYTEYSEYYDILSEILLDYCIKYSLDLYFLTRTFKKPKNNINSILNIGYFGALHTKNISIFLHDIMNQYDIVYENNLIFSKLDYNNINRCLYIDKDIDITDILDRYKSIVNDIDAVNILLNLK